MLLYRNSGTPTRATTGGMREKLYLATAMWLLSLVFFPLSLFLFMMTVSRRQIIHPNGNHPVEDSDKIADQFLIILAAGLSSEVHLTTLNKHY